MRSALHRNCFSFRRVLPPSRTLPHSHSAPIFKSKVNERLSWLKDLRLQKYADNLKKFTDEQLYQFTDREFEDAGLTKEAAQRLQKAIQYEFIFHFIRSM